MSYSSYQNENCDSSKILIDCKKNYSTNICKNGAFDLES